MKAKQLFLLAWALFGALACTGVAPEPEKEDDSKDFKLSATTLNVEAEGGMVQFKVGGTRDFHVNASPEWTQPSVDGRTVRVMVSQNDSEEERSGMVSVCDNEGQCLACTIKQKATVKVPVLSNWDDPFPHKSVIFRFTATWCGYCPRMASSVALAQEQNPGKFQLINIHGGSSDLEFAPYQRLATLYKISGYPTANVDGRRKVENYDMEIVADYISKYLKESEDNYPVASRAAFNSTFNPSDSKLNIDLFLFLRYAGDYKVSVFLVEDGIIAPQANYEGESWTAYEHNEVARMVLTDVLGDAFTVAEDQSMVRRQYFAQIPVTYKTENMKIMIIVQRAFGTQKKLSGDFGDFYVDNCVTGPLGADLPL